MSDNGEHNDREKGDIFWTQNALMFFGGIATLAVFCFSVYAAKELREGEGYYFVEFFGAFGVMMTIGFAAFGVGGILGFLFGIPKAIALENHQRPNVDVADEDVDDHELKTQRYRSNTNLEEISDWLTKIIVGATLIEAKAIVGVFDEIITQASNGLGPIPFGKSITGAVVISFLILGFFAIYLMTRLYLASAFSRLEEALTTAYQREKRLQAIVDQRFDDLGDVEKQMLKELLDAQGNVITLAATFKRHSPEHFAWQSLRDRGLVTLRGGGKWKPGSIATLTEHGKRIREQLNAAVMPTPRPTPPT